MSFDTLAERAPRIYTELVAACGGSLQDAEAMYSEIKRSGAYAAAVEEGVLAERERCLSLTQYAVALGGSERKIGERALRLVNDPNEGPRLHPECAQQSVAALTIGGRSLADVIVTRALGVH